jgi:hypothetical protein
VPQKYATIGSRRADTQGIRHNPVLGKRHFLAALFDGCQEIKLDLR